MKLNQKYFKIASQVFNFAFGITSVFAGVNAFMLSYTREPERYLVAALVMICGGILIALSSISKKFV